MKIDPKKIGSGSHFKEGSWKNTQNIGLKGQLSALKRAGRHGSTKNLSDKNLEAIYGIISKHLKHGVTSEGTRVSSHTKQKMRREAEQLIYKKGSEFTREDKDDFVDIINSL